MLLGSLIVTFLATVRQLEKVIYHGTNQKGPKFLLLVVISPLNRLAVLLTTCNRKNMSYWKNKVSSFSTHEIRCYRDSMCYTTLLLKQPTLGANDVKRDTY